MKCGWRTEDGGTAQGCRLRWNPAGGDDLVEVLILVVDLGEAEAIEVTLDAAGAEVRTGRAATEKRRDVGCELDEP